MNSVLFHEPPGETTKPNAVVLHSFCSLFLLLLTSLGNFTKNKMKSYTRTKMPQETWISNQEKISLEVKLLQLLQLNFSFCIALFTHCIRETKTLQKDFLPSKKNIYIWSNSKTEQPNDTNSTKERIIWTNLFRNYGRCTGMCCNSLPWIWTETKYRRDKNVWMSTRRVRIFFVFCIPYTSIYNMYN